MKAFRLYNDNLIVEGDCFSVIPQLIKQERQVDHIISDPPYGIGFKDKDLTWDNPNSVNWALFFGYADKLLKLNGNLILFQGYTNAHRLIDLASPYFKLHNWITWDRIKGRRRRDNMVSVREEILWFVKTSCQVTLYNSIESNTPRIGGRNHKAKYLTKNRILSNVWSDIMPVCPSSKEKVQHPTQKPLELMERTVRIWSNEGDVILDPFMGSGSTGIACMRLGRRFIGIEREHDYFNLASSRFERGF